MGSPNLVKALDRLGITQEEIGRVLGLSQPSVHRKLAGFREFTLSEINALLSFLRDRDSSITYEQLFAAGEEQKAEAIA